MPNQVVDWRELEMDLRRRLRERRLVVEIGLDAALQKDAEAALQQVIRDQPTPAGLVGTVPALLVVCLVAHGVYRYEQGNYWDGLPISGIGQPFGQAFERGLEMLGLEPFDEMVEQDNAARYVARILAHGGIPKYCLGDYFGLIQAGLRRGLGDGSEMLAHWRSRRAAFAGVDVPVRRFLFFGRSIARDFLDRSIDLFVEWGTSGTFPTPEEAGVPVFVITELRRLGEQGAVDRSTAQRRRTASVPRPTLQCDPWDIVGPTVALPAVSTVPPSAVWEVAGDAAAVRERVSLAADKDVPVAPSRRWDVALRNEGDELVDVTFEGLDHIPALFFDPRNGRLLTPGLGLPAEPVWVLRPADKQLRVRIGDGETAGATVTEKLPEPTGPWSGYEFEVVDLTGAGSLSIGQDSEWRTLSLRSTSRPVIDGDFLPATVAVEGLRVCVSDPVLSAPEGEVIWQVGLSVDGDRTTFELPSGESLDLGPFLPPDRAAVIAVSARGVLGSDLRDQFVWVPALVVSAPERLVLPRQPPPVVGVTSPRVPIVGRDGVNAELQPEPGGDSVEVAVGGATAPLVVRVQLPVLRWGRSDGAATQLGVDVIPLSTVDFALDSALSLAVSTGRHGTQLTLSLEVAGRPAQQWDPVAASGSHGQHRYDLARLTDTVRVLDDRADLTLFVGAAGVPVRVASIVPAFEFSDLRAEGIRVGDDTLVRVTFSEQRTVRRRLLRLWAEHRPWAPPIDAPIPDGVTGEIEVEPVERLPLGHYLAELTVDDGFSEPRRPAPDAPGVTRFCLGDPRDVVVNLRGRAEHDPLAVIESILVDGTPVRRVLDHEFGEVVSPALAAWFTLSRVDRADWRAQRSRDVLLTVLAKASASLAEVEDVEDMLEDVEAAELLAFAIELAGVVNRDGRSVRRGIWRLEPALATVLGVGLREPDDADDVLEFTGWDPDEPLSAIEEAGAGTGVDQVWLGRGLEQLDQIRTLIQFDVRPRPLGQDGRIAATFEWLRSNLIDPGVVERWRSAHHSLTRRPLPTSPAIRRHLDARLAPRGVASWADFPRMTLAAALLVCGQTHDASLGVRALVEASGFAPQQVRRDLVLGWILTRELVREFGPDDLPTEQIR